MNPFRTLALFGLSTLVWGCGPTDADDMDDTDDTEAGDTELDDDTELEDDTETDDTDDTDVAQVAPCSAAGTAETRVTLDPTGASAFYSGGGALRGIPIEVIPEAQTTWKAETDTGATVALETGVTHRVVVAFDPPVQLARTPANGIDLDLVPTQASGEVAIMRLTPSIVSEGSLTHDEASLTLIGSSAIAAAFSERPGVTGGSATTGSTLSCVAWEIVPATAGSYSFERVNIRMVEDGDTSRAPNPFRPTPIER